MRNNLPRKRPCASCPYRCDVPSGVWDQSEYAKLPQYDGEIVDQAQAGALAQFYCHQQDGHLCAGWVGHRDPADLLALRLAVGAGHTDEAVFDYETDVRLFPTGAAAAEHGARDVETPSWAAVDVIRKVIRVQEARVEDR